MNVLIVGLGSIARKHIEALNTLESKVKIYALRSNLNAENEDQVQNIYGLDNLDVIFDFAIISNPTYLHYQFIEELSNRRIPLFIEKPAVNVLDNVQKLIDLVDKNNVTTYIACNLRFHSCLSYLKSKIESESMRINELNIYCGSHLPDWRPGKDFRTIYSANADMGGGVHLDLFHELDYTVWLFGLPNKWSSLLRNVSSLNIDAVDYANYILEYDFFTANIVLNYYRKKPKRIIEIVLDNETLVVDLINNTITNDIGEVIFEDKKFLVKDTYSAQLHYFINCLENKQKPMNSLKESVEILKIVLQDE